jgi:hypothetical protein
MLNTAIVQAKISESFEEYLEIFDKFYADDVQVSSETQHEPIRGKARAGSLLLNFLVPLHVMAEVGGLVISIKQTTISSDAANEIHSAWTLNIVGVSGKTCTLSWRTLRKWNGSRVVYEHHYDQQRSGEPLTFDDLSFDMVEPVAHFQGGAGIGPSVAAAFIATRDRSVSSKLMVVDHRSGANSGYRNTTCAKASRPGRKSFAKQHRSLIKKDTTALLYPILCERRG